MRVKNPAAKLYRKFLLLSKNNLNEDAIFYLKKAAKKGHAAAQFELGWLYKKGSICK
jgi:TPR repeat protein